jgi:hypothetical protein
MTSGDIMIICDHVTTIVYIFAVCFLARLFLQWLLRPQSPKTIIKPDDNDNKIMELELKRQDRVRALMREICELTKDFNPEKGNDGLYNNAEATNLFDLYKKIDAHVKLPIKLNENEQQSPS